ncbi:hypothetical protein CTheo_2746 [Ceratobasidium theobromae]|uniref:Carbohydrate esterase family 16 protein n=1 Tax=Ceratobasidium theobromae TaxID=1582974 RepID=A0A5N5QRC3_9AGAM|nr:hypothetical protein CTheo_2746 [Ceratobasidium theobromae]
MYPKSVIGVSLGVALAASAVPALNRPRADSDYNDGIHLAIGPTCGIPSVNGSVVDVNAGLSALPWYKTIVSFGDSFTSDGKFNGSEPDPAVQTGTSPRYGGRFANGYVWIENLANDTGAHLLDYAVPGAVTDTAIWPSKATESSFVQQVAIFQNQSHAFDPATTLYSVFFGINDFSASARDGDHMLEAAEALLGQVELLIESPTNARSFLVIDDYGRGTHTASGLAFKTRVFNGLSSIQQENPQIKFAGQTDFAYLWDGILKTPGYQAFGYNSTTYCTPSSTSTVGACSDPAHTFYWINGHPSKQTHRIMADYIKEVLEQCTV